MLCAVQVLEVMWDDDVALCLTPQAFTNIHPTADIWNNINLQVRLLMFSAYITLNAVPPAPLSLEKGILLMPIIKDFSCTAQLNMACQSDWPSCAIKTLQWTVTIAILCCSKLCSMLH
jgi:hypothetical protein